jgi:hypothetical protein
VQATPSRLLWFHRIACAGQGKGGIERTTNMATNHTTQNKIVKESDAEYNYDTYQHHEIRRIARWMAKHIACTTQSVIS